MATGACGINCDVCGLKIAGICSTCGSGTSEEGKKKALAQEHLLGAPCAILACARMNRIDYCMRDCQSFPCENFQEGLYPYSQGFLDMQQRRRNQKQPRKSPDGADIVIPETFWTDLKKRNPETLCDHAGAEMRSDGQLEIDVIYQPMRLDLNAETIYHQQGDGWVKIDDPLLKLILLVYLLNVTHHNIQNRQVSVKDLKDAHFFQGPHAFRTESLKLKYGNDPKAFLDDGQALGGQAVDMADAAFSVTVLPKIPVYLLLWAADEEFPAEVSILFDASIEKHLPADGIWGLVHLLIDRLMEI
jgi:hypothetical protein